MTSVYFLTMAVLQVPVGVGLDRHGPRRVQSAFMLVAAAGAALFAVADGLLTLVLARLLIGIGFAPALMAGLKAIVSWFPNERIALANGCMVMLGTLGPLTATAPAELAAATDRAAGNVRAARGSDGRLRCLDLFHRSRAPNDGAGAGFGLGQLEIDLS